MDSLPCVCFENKVYQWERKWPFGHTVSGGPEPLGASSTPGPEGRDPPGLRNQRKHPRAYQNGGLSLAGAA